MIFKFWDVPDEIKGRLAKTAKTRRFTVTSGHDARIAMFNFVVVGDKTTSLATSVLQMNRGGFLIALDPTQDFHLNRQVFQNWPVIAIFSVPTTVEEAYEIWNEIESFLKQTLGVHELGFLTE